MKRIAFVVLLLIFIAPVVFAAKPAPKPVAVTQDQLSARRVEFMNLMAANQANLAEMNKLSQDQLAAKLQFVVKDQRRQQIVLRIDSKIKETNANRAEYFVSALNQIEDALSRVISRTNKAETAGNDVTAVRGLITTTAAAITTSRSAVSAEANKIYDISVVSDDNLKLDVGMTRQRFVNDLKAVRDTISAARDSVRAAIIALGGIQGVDELRDPTLPTDASSTTSTATSSGATTTTTTQQ